MNNTLDSEWKVFVELVMPNDASTIQYTEMRRAFYSGAICMLNILNEAALQDLETFNKQTDLLMKEIQLFGREINNAS